MHIELCRIIKLWAQNKNNAQTTKPFDPLAHWLMRSANI
jgi:hypothetical protein